MIDIDGIDSNEKYHQILLAHGDSIFNNLDGMDVRRWLNRHWEWARLNVSHLYYINGQVDSIRINYSKKVWLYGSIIDHELRKKIESAISSKDMMHIWEIKRAVYRE